MTSSETLTQFRSLEYSKQCLCDSFKPVSQEVLKLPMQKRHYLSNKCKVCVEHEVILENCGLVVRGLFSEDCRFESCLWFSVSRPQSAGKLV